MKRFISALFFLTFCSFSFINLVGNELVASKNVKLVIFVPETHVDEVRKALGEAGAGKIGNYDHCSFTTKGVAQWRANENANPYAGEKGAFASADEDRIETICAVEILSDVLEKVQKVHPYEQMGYDIYPMLELK